MPDRSNIIPTPTVPTPELPEIASDPVQAAKAAGLRYVSDEQPGIRRRRTSRGFSYRDSRGQPIRDAKELERIQKLGIPPAWTEVWICADPRGHLQATGRDAKGRKQYRYHERWRQARDETKYERMIAFGQALPVIRARTDRELALPGLPREKVLALVVRLLESTLIRVGNEEYAKQNGSYGLTTLRTEHVDVTGTQIHFHFRGKSGKEHSIGVRDRRLASIVRRMRDLPGQEMFQYRDDAGDLQTIDSADVNEYLREITGEEFTAKDFRTWAGTVLAAQSLCAMMMADTPAQAKKNVVEAIKAVSERLGNTPAICRKSYVHPAVLESYLEGNLPDSLKDRVEDGLAEGLDRLRPEELAVLAFLQRRLVPVRQTADGGSAA